MADNKQESCSSGASGVQDPVILLAILMAVLACLFGFGIGGALGAAEDSIEGFLESSAKAVMETVYHGDDGKADKVTSKAKRYIIRAHLHGGVMGTAALALIWVLLTVRPCRIRNRVLSLALGAGALGYPLFWLLSALKAPSLGGTGAAKESLRWLAIPSSGLFLLGTLAVVAVLVRGIFASKRAE